MTGRYISTRLPDYTQIALPGARTTQSQACAAPGAYRVWRLALRTPHPVACQDPFIYGPPLLAVVSCSWDELEVGCCLAWQRALKWLLLGRNSEGGSSGRLGPPGWASPPHEPATAARPGVTSLAIGAQCSFPSLGFSNLFLIFIPKPML